MDYEGGTYEWPLTEELVTDPRTTALFDVGVGDTLHIGGTISTATLWRTVVGQALTVGVIGGVVGLGLTPVGVAGLNVVATEIVGIEGLVRTRPWIYGIGAIIALGIGLVGSILAGWRVLRIQPNVIIR